MQFPGQTICALWWRCCHLNEERECGSYVNKRVALRTSTGAASICHM